MTDFVFRFTNLCMMTTFGKYQKMYAETMELVHTSGKKVTFYIQRLQTFPMFITSMEQKNDHLI